VAHFRNFDAKPEIIREASRKANAKLISKIIIAVKSGVAFHEELFGGEDI
jgi:hypothetical protein